jgi:hypothetical protein
MRRLRPLTEAECYARCYGGWEANVHVLTLEPRQSHNLQRLDGEAMRLRFEELFEARDPHDLAEPEAA